MGGYIKTNIYIWEILDFSIYTVYMLQEKVIVGSEEWCSFPILGIPTIKARVDSGAKTSALHAINIAPITKDGEAWVKFDINPIQNNLKTILHCEAKLIGNRLVKSSSGYSEKRFVVLSVITLRVRWDLLLPKSVLLEELR